MSEETLPAWENLAEAVRTDHRSVIAPRLPRDVTLVQAAFNEALNDRQRMLLTWRYGLADNMPRSLKRLAEVDNKAYGAINYELSRARLLIHLHVKAALKARGIRPVLLRIPDYVPEPAITEPA